jgi:hypothetical protein
MIRHIKLAGVSVCLLNVLHSAAIFPERHCRLAEKEEVLFGRALFLPALRPDFFLQSHRFPNRFTV